ncbi:MAG: KOW domain-containing RNA-binding protein [Clostridiales bacterium]|nr:KOW domain-containing RNA-binding protein [Clostridiales bacterium]
MKTWTSGGLAVSLAGHDKGTLYVVIEEMSESASASKEGKTPAASGEKDYLLLSDGRRRTLEHPKKKKVKHMQMITHLPQSLSCQMREITLDAHVRKILKEYKAYQRLHGNVRE